MMYYSVFHKHRKELFKSVHMLVHLNLAISLFLAYLVFAAGAEPGTSSKVQDPVCVLSYSPVLHSSLAVGCMCSSSGNTTVLVPCCILLDVV